MATRIIIVDSSGQPIFGCDSHHGDDHAAAWIEDSLALLAEQGITDAAVIEIDPVAGGDEARDTVRRLHELRLETRQRPDGAHEIVGLHRREGETVGATRPAAQALRVLHAPGHIATPRATIRNKPGAIAERAQRWRAQTHATHQRIMRGKP